ncbi:MAG: hypothetical protein HYZ75_01135 [Elusimicrobia bacterium]|nr:hypothetical protein [Elusimicrobiota bacterium]
MKNAEKLKSGMQLGKVYRRQDLEGLSTAVDRDLKRLVESGVVRKLSGGLYYRPEKNVFGFAPPEDRDLVRAFLKSDDFLLTSYTYFNRLGLGLTQVYNHHLVYNHKRTGDFRLGGRRFTFRVVPAYPTELSKEFLLVDLLKNLRKLPDDTSAVLRNLRSSLSKFDRSKLEENLELYGNPGAKKILHEALAPLSL